MLSTEYVESASIPFRFVGAAWRLCVAGEFVAELFAIFFEQVIDSEGTLLTFDAFGKQRAVQKATRWRGYRRSGAEWRGGNGKLCKGAAGK